MSLTEIAAARAARLPESVLHAVHRRAEQAEAAGHDVLRLHVGEPAFGAPETVVAAVSRAMADGRTGYTSAEGLPLLRERLAARLDRAKGVAASPDRVLVTPGSSQALATIMLAVCQPGEEVLLPAVHWPIYVQGAAVARLAVRTYALGSDHSVDADRLLAAVTPATRLVVVNSPANPTGAVCHRATMAELLDRVRGHDLWLVGDEAYEHFVYEGEHTALASLERDVDPDERQVFSVHTFSKAYGMTGYRMGYVAAPTGAAATALRRVSEGTIIAPSTPVQYGALVALDDEGMPARAAAHVRAVRDAALPGAVDAALLRRLPPAGWYALLDISASGLGSTAFVDRLLAEQDVAVAPGDTFVAPGAPDPRCVRVAFCGDRDMTVEGMRRLRLFVAGLGAGETAETAAAGQSTAASVAVAPPGG